LHQIRLKRLAKLQAQQGSPSPSSTPATPAQSTSSTPTPAARPAPAPKAEPKPIPAPSPAPPIKAAEASTSSLPASTPKKKAIPTGPTPLDVSSWADKTISLVLGVTLQVRTDPERMIYLFTKSSLQKEVAEKSNYETVWLKPLADELVSEGVMTAYGC
jgi:ubiquitin conjugation factor E4 B